MTVWVEGHPCLSILSSLIFPINLRIQKLHDSCAQILNGLEICCPSTAETDLEMIGVPSESEAGPPPDTTSLLTWDVVCFSDWPLGKCKCWPQWQQNLKPPIGGWDASFWNLNPNKNSTPCMREICYILLTAFWCLAEWEFVANDSCFPHWGVSFEFSNREVWFQTSKAKTGSQQKGAVWVFFSIVESCNISVKIQFKQTCGEKPWLDDNLWN